MEKSARATSELPAHSPIGLHDDDDERVSSDSSASRCSHRILISRSVSMLDRSHPLSLSALRDYTPTSPDRSCSSSPSP